MNETTVKRVFISINVPDHIKNELGNVIQLLQEKKICKGRYVPKHNVHITLKFLGSISQQQLHEVEQRLSEVMFPSLTLQFEGFDFFSHGRHGYILFASFISEQLTKLALAINTTLQGLFDPEHQAFVNHATLARIHKSCDIEKIMDEIKDIKIDKELFTIKSFELMESEITNIGSKYTVIKQYALID